MNDAFFKQLATELSPAEETEFLRQLAAAYREHEAAEQRPEVERIAERVRQRLRQGTVFASHTDQPENGASPKPPER
jgi:hypothetical protein